MKPQTIALIWLLPLICFTTSCYETAEEVYEPGQSELFFPLKTGNSWTFMEYVTDTTTTWPNRVKTVSITKDSAIVKWLVIGSMVSGNEEFYHIEVRYPDFPERKGYFTISNRHNRIYHATENGYSPFRYNQYNFMPRYLMHFDYYTLDYGKPYPQDGQSEFSTGWHVVTRLGTLPAVKGVYKYYLSGHFGNFTETSAWFFSPLVGATRYSYNKMQENRNSAWGITLWKNFTCEGRLISCRLN